MKLLFGFIAVFTITNYLCPTATSYPLTVAPRTDTSSPEIILFEDFTDNKNNWTVAETKKAASRIDGGFYYLTAFGHAYGEAHEVKIDTRKDFQIETRIKIISGNSEHKNYYSMLFWGREAMNAYNFTFAKDGFASVEVCYGKNQSDCIVKNRSLQKTNLSPEDFNVYSIRKTGKTYSFFVNGTKIYEMPFAPFFGNLIGFGAGRKVTLAIDYLKVHYL